MNRGAGGVGELTSYVISCVVDNVPPSVRWHVIITDDSFRNECVLLTLMEPGDASAPIRLTTTDVMRAGGAGNFIVSLGKRIRLLLPSNP